MSLWRPHTTAILIVGVVAIILASAIAFVAANFQPKTEIRMGSGVFSARVVDTPKTLEKGLSGTPKMSPNDAMLFVFESDAKWGIWMKDMKVAIDIVWLNNKKEVIYIVKNASPDLSTSKTFTPNDPARYVIEIAAGGVDRNNVRIGERVLFTLEGESN